MDQELGYKIDPELLRRLTAVAGDLSEHELKVICQEMESLFAQARDGTLGDEEWEQLNLSDDPHAIIAPGVNRAVRRLGAFASPQLRTLKARPDEDVHLIRLTEL